MCLTHHNSTQNVLTDAFSSGESPQEKHIHIFFSQESSFKG